MDEAMGFLLPTLVLLVASTAALLATRIWKARARGSRCSRAAPRTPEQSRPQGPAAPGSPLYIPCSCGPGCIPCMTAAQELQDLVTPLWPGVSFPRDSEMWQQSWEDLEQLLERGCLPCCASSSSSGSPHPPQSRSEGGHAPHGGGLTDGSRCSPTARRSCPSLRMHVAKKNLEVKLRAQPCRVWRSRERLEGSPCSSESLPRSCGLSGSCPGLHGGDGAGSSPSSPPSAGIGGTRSALRMHVAKKNLEVRLGAWPAPVRSSQQRVAQREGPWRSCSSHGAAALPAGNVPRSQSEKILQRQRELEFPLLQGAPPGRRRLLLAAQMLLRMLYFK